MEERFRQRVASVETLIELAAEDPRIVVCDADSKEMMLLDRFAARYPERSFTFGICEQNMVTAAAGMATTGLRPFVHTYAQFLAMRAADQIRNSVAYPNLPVTFCVSHVGLDTGPDGVTHQTCEDLAVMRALPNMTVLCPGDDVETREMVRFASKHTGPVYLRLVKSPLPRLHEDTYVFQPGRTTVLRPGHDLSLLAHGIMVQHALAAAETLAGEGVAAQVLAVPTLKPLDEAALAALVAPTGAAVTVEDHWRFGGLGSAVAESLARHAPLPLEMVAAPDTFAESGRTEQLFAKYGMDQPAILAAARRVLERKG